MGEATVEDEEITQLLTMRLGQARGNSCNASHSAHSRLYCGVGLSKLAGAGLALAVHLLI